MGCLWIIGDILVSCVYVVMTGVPLTVLYQGEAVGWYLFLLFVLLFMYSCFVNVLVTLY